jgi:hypothetical protein
MFEIDMDHSPKRPVLSTRCWPMPGPPSDEFEATWLTFKTAS